LNALDDVAATEHRFFGDHCDVVRDETSETPRVRMTMQRYVRNLCGHVGVGVDSHAMLYRMAWGAIEGSREATGKRKVVETITPYLGTSADVVGGIERTFPCAPIVHLVRDGRDVLVSGVMHWLTKSGSGADEAQRMRRRAWLLEGGEALDRLLVDEEIVEWTSAWREAHACVWGFGSSRVLRVSYEQMHADLSEVVRRVCAHIGAQVDDESIARSVAATSFEAMTGGRTLEDPGAHVRKGGVGDWRRWLTRRDGEVFEELAGDLLRESGYEESASWVGRLPDRLPQTTIEKGEISHPSA
jgi:hypothetical protein